MQRQTGRAINRFMLLLLNVTYFARGINENCGLRHVWGDAVSCHLYLF
jgi:hypothetical protein